MRQYMNKISNNSCRFMNLQLFALLFFVICIGCSNEDYEYSGNVRLTGVSTETEVYIYVFEKSSMFMELPVKNGERLTELIPGYYTIVLWNNGNQIGRVNFQIIAGKLTIIKYNNGGNFSIEYE